MPFNKSSRGIMLLDGRYLWMTGLTIALRLSSHVIARGRFELGGVFQITARQPGSVRGAGSNLRPYRDSIRGLRDRVDGDRFTGNGWGHKYWRRLHLTLS